MRICVASSAPLPTERAYGIAISNTVMSMLELGHHVDICAPIRANYEDPWLLDGPDVIVTDLSTRSWHRRHNQVGGRFGPFLFLLNRKLIQRRFAISLKSQPFDLVWTRDVLLARAAASGGVPVVLEEHHIPSKRQEARYRKLLIHGGHSLSLIGISPAVVDALLTLGFRPTQTKCEPSGVGVSFFRSPAERVEGSESVKIGYFGSGSVRGTDKGLLDLIAACLYAKQTVSVQLHIVGLSETELINIRLQAQSTGLSTDFVQFTPRLAPSEVPAEMETFDVLVAPFPDTHELRGTSPLKLMEYAAIGRPILATDVPAVRNVLSPDSFFAYKFGDHQSFVNGLNEILANPTEVRRRTRAASGLARKSDWLSRTSRILDRLPDR